MGQKMTWEEMKKAFPDEWVAVVNSTTDEKGEIDGEVVAHYDDKDEFYKHTKEIVNQFEVACHQLYEQGVEGLLGMTFLKNFDFCIFPSKQIIRIA